MLKMSLRYCKISLLYWRSDWRVKALLLITFCVILNYTGGICQLSELTGEAVSPWIFNFLFAGFYIGTGLLKVLLLLGAVLLFCNAPFLHRNKPFLILRCGREAWAFGDILYILTGSFLYTLYIFLCSLLCFIPRIRFQTDWGKIIGTLAYTDASSQYAPTLIMNQKVLDYYTPLQATGISFFLVMCGFVFIGLVIYLVNRSERTRGMGMAAAVFFILLDPLMIFLNAKKARWFSPLSWISIEQLAPVKEQGYPALGYVILALLALLLILSCVLMIGKDKISIIGEVDHGT